MLRAQLLARKSAHGLDAVKWDWVSILMGSWGPPLFTSQLQRAYAKTASICEPPRPEVSVPAARFTCFGHKAGLQNRRTST